MMLFVNILINAAVYGIILAVAIKLFFIAENRALFIDERPGIFSSGLSIGWIVGVFGVGFFFILSLFTNHGLGGRFRGDDIFLFISLVGGLPVYYFYRGLRQVLLGDHDMEAIDDFVEVPNSALAGLFILGAALAPVLVRETPVGGDPIKGALTLLLVLACYYSALMVVNVIKGVIVHFGFEDAYLAWGRFSWSLLGGAMVVSYYVVVIGAAGPDSGLLGALAKAFFMVIKVTTAAFLGFFW